VSVQTVEDLLEERARVEPGLSSGFVFSVALHVLATALMVLAPMLFPRQIPKIPLAGTFVRLPPGGRGTPDPAPPSGPETKAEPAPPVTAPPITAPPAPPPPVTAPPAKVVKPPVEKPKGLPELDQKKKPTKATPPPAPPRTSSSTGQSTKPAGGTTRPGGSTPNATGSTPQTPGVALAPPGEGVPGGNDPFGDWYLASVQRKIWMIWVQQTKPPTHPPIHVEFTIEANGTVNGIRIVQSSGNRSLDFSAHRAVSSAAPFNPLPRHYGTSRKTIQAIFAPM
jgi:TonB family protein